MTRLHSTPRGTSFTDSHTHPPDTLDPIHPPPNPAPAANLTPPFPPLGRPSSLPILLLLSRRLPRLLPPPLSSLLHSNPYPPMSKRRPPASKRKQYDNRNKGYGPKGSDDEADGKVPHPGSYANDLYKTGALPLPPPAPSEEGGPEPAKLSKRKLAFLVGFCGKAYQGMQMNPSSRTIQGELERALYRAGMISAENYGFPKKYGWSNSARTDKGVHAAAQVVSARVAMPSTDLDKLRTGLNEELPGDVRVLDVKMVTKGFCAKTNRDKVRYSYFLPTYLLQPAAELGEAFRSHLGLAAAPSQPWDAVTGPQKAALQEAFSEYRLPPSSLPALAEAFGRFEGTKKYHNYTNGKDYEDPSANRYM